MSALQTAHGDDSRAEVGRMTRCKNLPMAVALVAGVLMFAWGASVLITSPVQSVAEQIRHHAEQTQTAECR